MAKNPIAKALKSPHLAPKVVKNKKAYNRKIKHKEQIKGREDGALWRIYSLILHCGVKNANVSLTLHYL